MNLTELKKNLKFDQFCYSPDSRIKYRHLLVGSLPSSSHGNTGEALVARLIVVGASVVVEATNVVKTASLAVVASGRRVVPADDVFRSSCRSVTPEAAVTSSSGPSPDWSPSPDVRLLSSSSSCGMSSRFGSLSDTVGVVESPSTLSVDLVSLLLWTYVIDLY